jgi:hypothetical protein
VGRVPYRSLVTGERIPDAIEPAVGWRAWDVVSLDGALRLCSLSFWTIWMPDRAALAVCRRVLVDRSWSRLPEHAAPDLRCTCGIYATRTAAQVLAYARAFRPRGDTVHRVLGRVSLWGTVVEAEAGWRGSQAYPSALFVPTARKSRPFVPGRLPAPREAVETVALELAAYGVPVEIVDARTYAELGERLDAPGEQALRARRRGRSS